MRYRSKIGKKKSRRDFSKYASQTHRKNILSSRPQRGGVRL